MGLFAYPLRVFELVVSLVGRLSSFLLLLDGFDHLCFLLFSVFLSFYYVDISGCFYTPRIGTRVVINLIQIVAFNSKFIIQLFLTRITGFCLVLLVLLV